MKHLSMILCLLLTPVMLFGGIKYVDLNGPVDATHFRSISSALSAAVTNDTIVVFPGTYTGSITIDKSVTVMGSGCETTVLTSNVTPTVTMSNGNAKLMWFAITSPIGNGLTLTSGTVANCVIRQCAVHGVVISNGSTGQLRNCVMYKNAGWGVTMAYFNSTASVYNCIARLNTSGGFTGYGSSYPICLNYSCGNMRWTSCNNGNLGDVDPLFVNPDSSDFHLQPGSPCINAGGGVTDPDNSLADMGYFGGPDAPVFPIVSKMEMIRDGSTIRIDIKGKANY